MKKFILIIIFTYLSVFAFAGKLNVKDQISFKISSSWYYTFDIYWYLFSPLNIDFIDYKLSPNLNVNIDWKVNEKCEIGIYGGVFKHPIVETFTLNYLSFYAPTFGINFNYYFKKIYSKKNFERWGIYFTGKYGGMYMKNWWNNGYYSIPVSHYFATANYKRYRHEYGVGLGCNFYINAHIGLNFEILTGQFSYYPDILNSPINSRVGLKIKL